MKATYRCLLDICRTGTPDSCGWSKEDMIEFGIGNVQTLKKVNR